MLDNWSTVEQTAPTRSTRTNEAGRDAVPLPLLGLIEGPLSLIEVGASGGPCLYPDRYSYRYDEHQQIDPAAGPSPVLPACATTGSPPLPEKLPTIAYRAGIDLDPLDVADDGMAWFDSLIWPEHHIRICTRRVVRSHPSGPRPREGRPNP